jgi:hypothetical protein
MNQEDYVPFFSRKLLAEAEIVHNSFRWTILQGTSLFSRFCSASMPVKHRKQVFSFQNRGGGTLAYSQLHHGKGGKDGAPSSG